MSKLDVMNDRNFVFGSIHIISNKKETLMERELKEYRITFKQWLLMAIIRNSFETPPTLNETARAMGSSHQNVKKIASILEEKGYAVLEKDKRDSRATRIRLTEESDKLSARIQGRANAFTAVLFEGLSDSDMAKARQVLQGMMANLTKLEQKDMEEV
jgi:DNA-binding MarR family transcriptional regulator